MGIAADIMCIKSSPDETAYEQLTLSALTKICRSPNESGMMDVDIMRHIDPVMQAEL